MLHIGTLKQLCFVNFTCEMFFDIFFVNKGHRMEKEGKRERERERDGERVNFADVVYRIADDFSITAMRLS